MAEYLRPETLATALGMLKGDALKGAPFSVLAGGTDFYPARVGPALDENLLDISALNNLRAIDEQPDHWRLGALTTWSDIIRAELPPMFDDLKLAAREVGGVVNEPLKIDMKIRKEEGELYFDLSGSSPPCQGPMNSVLATTKSSIYLAMKHIFSEVPINAGTFEPLHITDLEGTFLYAKYPRPVSGCAAEVSQRIAEAVFDALAKAIPERLFAAPAGTPGNFALGGYDPARERAYVLYFFSGGGYGGSPQGDGLTNGCSTIGISKSQLVEVLEQRYPVLFDEYSLHEGSGGAGEYRGGFGINYTVRLRRGTARASMVMDHGRFGPNGMAGGAEGGVNRVSVERADGIYHPPHLSKDQGVALTAGDCVHISTPGGGGYGDAQMRDLAKVLQDVIRGYFAQDEAERLFAVVLTGDPLGVDNDATTALRRQSK